MLDDAGPKGVSSKTFIESYLPRAAARIQELKDEGVPITTEREGKYVRYFIGVGTGRERSSSGVDRPAVERVLGADSGEASTGDRGQTGDSMPRSVEAVSGAPARSVPSMFDCDDCLTWGDAA